MRLKEIEMDLPYVEDEERIRKIQKEDGLDYQEAIKRDYELNWKEKRRKFQLMTRCMTSMIERIMDSVETNDCWKLLFECVEKKEEKKVKNLLGVYSVQVSFNVNQFWMNTDDEKKKLVIKTVIDAITELNGMVSFDLIGVKVACFKIIENQYLNEWIWKKSIRVKGINIQIKLQHEVKTMDIYMVFFDKQKNLIKQKLLISTLPDERVYSMYLGKIEKISDFEVALVTKTGERFIQMVEG